MEMPTRDTNKTNSFLTSEDINKRNNITNVCKNTKTSFRKLLIAKFSDVF